jgi:hypothetical protein
MTDAEEAALLLKRTPGGLESLSETARAPASKTSTTSSSIAPEDLLKGFAQGHFALRRTLTKVPARLKNGGEKCGVGQRASAKRAPKESRTKSLARK